MRSSNFNASNQNTDLLKELYLAAKEEEKDNREK